MVADTLTPDLYPTGSRHRPPIDKFTSQAWLREIFISGATTLVPRATPKFCYLVADFSIRVGFAGDFHI